MAQLKKQRRKKGDGEGKEPPLNAPFLQAKKELMQLVKPVHPSLRPGPEASPKRAAPAPPAAPEEKISDGDLFLREMSGVSRLGQQTSGRDRPIEQEREVLLRQSEDAETYAQLSDLVEG